MISKIRFVFLLLLFSSSALATVEFKSNFYFSLLAGNGNDFLARSLNTLYLGGGGFHFGGVYLHDPLHDYVTDTGYGGGIRLGEKSYIEITGGYFERKYDNLVGKGFFATVAPGIHFGRYFGVSCQVVMKKISSGDLDKRMIVDVLPYLGMRVGF